MPNCTFYPRFCALMQFPPSLVTTLNGFFKQLYHPTELFTLYTRVFRSISVYSNYC